MADKEKRSNPSEGAAQDDSQGPEDTQPIATATRNSVTELSDGLDDIARAVRVSTKKVRKFWYIPDSKNTQLRKIADYHRLPHPNDPLEILINAPELKRFFQTITLRYVLTPARCTRTQTPKWTSE